MKKRNLGVLILAFVLIFSSIVYAGNVSIDGKTQYLMKNGIKKDMLKGLGDNAEMINEIAKNNNLNSVQINNLVSTYLEKLDTTPRYLGIEKELSSDGYTLPTRPVKKEVSTLESNLSETSNEVSIQSSSQWQELSWNESTGAHWIIKSNYGYKEATGFINLPKVNVTSNDVPYMYFGAYTDTNSLCSDAGVHYVDSENGWQPFINILIWDDDTHNYIQFWDTADKLSINNPYINYKVTSYDTYDKFDLIIIDPATWETIKPWTVKSTDILSDSNPVNSSYSNLQMKREVTLAQHTEDLDNGSYLHNAKWDNVYIYNLSNVFGDRWETSQTKEAGKGNKPEHWATVTVNSYSPWYKDDISIDY